MRSRYGMGRRRSLLLIVASSFVLAVPGCGRDDNGGTVRSPAQAPTSDQGPASPAADASARWPAPPDPLERTVAAGLKPERKEFLIHHVHTHLDVFVDGKPITVPAGKGGNNHHPPGGRFGGASLGDRGPKLLC